VVAGADQIVAGGIPSNALTALLLLRCAGILVRRFVSGAGELIGIMNRLAICLTCAIIATAAAPWPAHTQTSDDELRIYAVGVLNVSPSVRPLSGHGVFLGRDVVITAAHVVGRWQLFSNPTISIADREISATVIKKGSFPQLDLAVLVVDDSALPVSLRLRRNPLCKTTPAVGMPVVIVLPDRTERSQIVSPKLIAPRYRTYFSSLVNEPHSSGSGVFDPERKCLLGIMSAAVMKQDDFRAAPALPNIVQRWDKSAGYFVPASVITNFIPEHRRF
jgi:hypothetical protein